CMVISVDYRLAPEAKFPTAVYDAFDSVQWVAEHHGELNVDPSRIAVGGDSAGGNLAAVACHLAKERGTPQILFQALIYPATDFTADNQSRKDFAEGYLLDEQAAIWMRDHYLRSLDDQTDPMASPALYSDFTGLPPALVITGEYDPLRDEGEAYGEQLRAAGVPVQISRYEGMIHGFYTMAAVVDKGKQAIQETANALRDAFGK
ncbi:MAG: alpha/beta hydrolase, partial [Tumebacillaceae bacterium]